MEKKTIYWVIAIIVVLVIIAIIASSKTETLPGEETEEAVSEEAVSEEAVSEEEGQIDDSYIPGQLEELSVDWLAVPVAEGKLEKTGENFVDFEVELKDDKLNPFEFRVELNDIVGFSLSNVDDKDYMLDLTDLPIKQNYSYLPAYIGQTQMIRVQVIERGEFNIGCVDCEEAMGRIVVF